MVRAGQAFFGDLRQHAANDAAQRIVDESVVLKSIVHGLSEIQIKASARMAGESTLPIAGKSRWKESGGLLLPGAPRTALTSAV